MYAQQEHAPVGPKTIREKLPQFEYYAVLAVTHNTFLVDGKLVPFST